MAFFISTSCRSQSLLPFSDIIEIEKDSSVLASCTCDELVEKANDKSFTLKNLAALRAVVRCKDFNFNIAQLSDFEKKLYAQEIRTLDAVKIENKLTADLSVNDLKNRIKTEKVAELKFKYFKLLRLKQRRNANRRDYIKTSQSMYKWSLKNYKDSLKQHKKATETDNNAYPILYEAAQLAVKTNWTEDSSAPANRIIDEVMTQAKGNPMAELLFFKGRILEEAKKNPQAVIQYDLAIEDIKKFNSKNLSFGMDRVLWLKAWILYKDKNYGEAEKAFAHLAAATVDLSEKSKALFYQGRCLKFLDQPVQAGLIFEGITQNDFFGYYGLVSYRELGKKFPALKSIKRTHILKYDLNLQFLADPERDLFKALIKYREFNISEKAIGLIAKTKENEINMALYLAKNSQIYMSLFRAFAKLDNNEKIDVFLTYPELVFPQPYPDQVKEMANKTNLPPSLIYSIMKQESAFNEKARSAADAMGLMQIIPKLALQLSKKFEVSYKGARDLFDPRINIQLGSFELMEQVRKQNGQLTYVAAAYNAGPAALSSWLKNRNRSDVLEFIEDIPYDETRTYVKLIARNKLFYERISNRDTEHDFPNNFLN